MEASEAVAVARNLKISSWNGAVLGIVDGAVVGAAIVVVVVVGGGVVGADVGADACGVVGSGVGDVVLFVCRGRALVLLCVLLMVC